jgi:hypothetical protein
MGEQNRVNRKRVIFASTIGALAIAVKFLMPAQVELQSKRQVDFQQNMTNGSAETDSAHRTVPVRSSFSPGSNVREGEQSTHGQAVSPDMAPSIDTEGSSAGSLGSTGLTGLTGSTGPVDVAVQPRMRGQAQPAAADTVGMGQFDPAMGSSAAGDAAMGTAAARLASMERVKIHFPSSQEMSGLESIRSRPQIEEGALQKAVPAREPSAADRAAKEQKELAKIKRDIGLPSPKAKLDGALYDPWANEYDSIVRSEEAKANKLAQEALKARQAEQRARRKSIQ